MKNEYDPQAVELAAQKHWEKNKSFEVKEDPAREKFYCLSMLPYPSGRLHMGHVRNYAIGDVIARYQRMRGKNVLQPFGWDAFGLPAENAALDNNLAPAAWTYGNIADMRKTVKRLGFAIDWSRELATCKPEYYRWEQWLFLQMYKKGLVYKKKAFVNWDPVDQTVLANEQVVNGCGWRSGAPVERREIAQWFLKITDYADELLEDLDKLTGWPEQVRTMQRNWIGRSSGVELTFNLSNSSQKITVFTTRPDTLMGVTYLALALEHPVVLKAAEKNSELAKVVKEMSHGKVAEAELATMEKLGIYTGLNAIHPISGEAIPIWTANFVLMEYGTGAVMAVPAHDQRDFEFAKKYALKIKQVIKPKDGSEWDFGEGAFVAEGILINSGAFSQLNSAKASDAIAEYLETHRKGARKVNYRLRDWGVSRQRYWGTPIPMLYCEKCGTVPVAMEDLPVILPEDVILTGPGSPLNTMSEFVHTTCPQCGGSARRETDTFDTFMESSWYYARYCCRDQNEKILDERANYWMPVDQYIGGIEHAVMHLLYARFVYKVLRDLGIVMYDEPFTNLLTQGMVLKNGAKMSKSKGNVVSPESLIEKYGADTARLFSIFASPPEQSLEWSDHGVEGSYRFLKRVWNFAYAKSQMISKINNAVHDDYIEQYLNNLNAGQKQFRYQIYAVLQQANNDMKKLQFNTVVSAAMKLFNLLQELSEVTAFDSAGLIYEGFAILLKLLAPITPHFVHQIWTDLKFSGDIIDVAWPEVEQNALKQEAIEMMVQINGKLRAKIVVAADAKEEEIKQVALTDENVMKFTASAKIKKIIVVPKRLVNIVL